MCQLLRKGPSLGVEQGWEREEDAAAPDDQEEDAGARLAHPGLERPHDGDVPGKTRTDFAQKPAALARK